MTNEEYLKRVDALFLELFGIAPNMTDREKQHQITATEAIYLYGPNYHGVPQHNKPKPRRKVTVIKGAGVYYPEDSGDTPRSYDIEVRDTVTTTTVDDVLNERSDS